MIVKSSAQCFKKNETFINALYVNKGDQYQQRFTQQALIKSFYIYGTCIYGSFSKFYFNRS